MAYKSIRLEQDGPVQMITLCRPQAYNTITFELRDELRQALDDAERDPQTKVILLNAEGPAFSAGFGLDWSTYAQAHGESTEERVWDSAADLQLIGSFADVFARLHTLTKPTVCAVQGWCIAGGTDLVFNCDLIICAESATFGYPPARVWGIPEQPWLWVSRLGLQQAKRFLFTGDEISSLQALELGLVLERVSEEELLPRTRALCQRIALLPLNQLQMIKLVLNDVARHQYDPPSSKLLGSLFDGVARHTQEGIDFVAYAEEHGWREAIRRRDDPFGDYGSRKE